MVVNAVVPAIIGKVVPEAVEGVCRLLDSCFPKEPAEPLGERRGVIAIVPLLDVGK
jgi:hypothetical protein